MDIERAVTRILRKLNRKGFNCRVVHVSEYGSQYIHVDGHVDGIRISNHREKIGSNYRYNIRADINTKQVIDGRYFFPIKKTSEAINFIIREMKKRQRIDDYDNRNKSKYIKIKRRKAGGVYDNSQ